MNYKVFSLKILELQYNAAKVSLAAAIQCIRIMIELSLMTIGNYSSWERRKAKKLEKTSVSQVEIPWVEFVGSLLCNERFSLGTLLSPLLKNQNLT